MVTPLKKLLVAVASTSLLHVVFHRSSYASSCVVSSSMMILWFSTSTVFRTGLDVPSGFSSPASPRFSAADGHVVACNMPAVSFLCPQFHLSFSFL